MLELLGKTSECVFVMCCGWFVASSLKNFIKVYNVSSPSNSLYYIVHVRTFEVQVESQTNQPFCFPYTIVRQTKYENYFKHSISSGFHFSTRPKPNSNFNKTKSKLNIVYLHKM